MFANNFQLVSNPVHTNAVEKLFFYLFHFGKTYSAQKWNISFRIIFPEMLAVDRSWDTG
jgi:hypothetical protein